MYTTLFKHLLNTLFRYIDVIRLYAFTFVTKSKNNDKTFATCMFVAPTFMNTISIMNAQLIFIDLCS